MGEPKFDERAQPASGSARGHDAGAGSTQADKLRAQCRGKSFAEGEAQLCPGGAVQLKPDPAGPGKGKPATGRKRTAELEKQNAALAVGVATREVHGVEERAQRAMDARRVTQRHDGLVSAQINVALDEADAGINAIREGVDTVELFVETMLNGDEEKRMKSTGVGAAMDAHRDAQAPDLFDALGVMLDLASGLKSLVKFGGVMSARRLRTAEGAGGPARMELFEAAHDALNSPKGAAKTAVEASDKAGKNAAGDTTTKMVGAVDAKLDVIDQGVARLEAFTTLEIFRDIASAVSDLNLRHKHALEVGLTYTNDMPTEVADRMIALGRDIEAIGIEIEQRVAKLRSLVKARGARPGEAQLAKGTRGRKLFDALRERPESCSLARQTRLEVTIDPSGETAENLRTLGFWVHCKDAEMRPTLDRSLGFRLPEVGRPRPGWATEDYLRITWEEGVPLESLLEREEQPHEDVRVAGPGGSWIVGAGEWDDPSRQAQIIESLNAKRFEPMHGP